MTRRSFGLAIAVLVVVAAVPRLIAWTDDFWLDEIWSLRLALVMDGPLDVLFRRELAHDNNHPLNTLWLYLLGEREGWLAYRAPAVVSGLVAVLLAVAAGARRSRLEGLVAGSLFAASYMLIAYSAEARGYSMAVLFALAALLTGESALDRGSARAVVGFWVASGLGFLSHLSFGHAYAALLAWSAWRALRTGADRRARVRRAVALHAVPLLGLVALYLVFVRHMVIGGGPVSTAGEVLTRTLAWTLGGPESAAMAVVSGALVAGVVAAGAVLAARAGSDRWVFDVAAVVVAPALVVLLLRPEFLVPRYFLVSIAFFLLVMAQVVARLLGARGPGAVLGAAMLALYLAGNAAWIAPFLRLGKGEYAAAVRHMAEHTRGDTIAVAREPDAGEALMLRFYGDRLPAGKRLRHVSRRELPPEGVEWLVVTVKTGGDPPGHIGFGPHAYGLSGVFGYSAPSGVAWWVYRRQRP